MHLKGKLIAMAVCLIWVVSTQTSASAQSPTASWTQPVKIFESADEAIYEPTAFADRSGAVHVLWRSSQNALYYTRLDRTGWSQPVDVLINANVASAVVDAQGTIHAIWEGQNHTLQYSTAPAGRANSARAWSSPVAIGNAFRHPQLTSDKNDGLHVAFASADGDTVQYMFSQDGGTTWSQSNIAAQKARLDSSMADARLTVGGDGAIHVVWTEYQLPDGWPPLGVYYSRSGDGGASWTPPLEMAGKGYDQITVAVADDTQVHVAWNGMAGVGGRYHRWSADDGKSWSAVDTIAAEGGTEGFPKLVVDSSGTVHILTTFAHCAHYARWDGHNWTPPQCISGPAAMASNYIEEAAMTVSEGNRLHAIFWDGRQRLWYTTSQTAAPHVPPTAWPLPGPTPTLVATETPTVAPIHTKPSQPLRLSAAGSTTPPDSAAPSEATFLIAVAPAAIFVLGIVLVRGVRRR